MPDVNTTGRQIIVNVEKAIVGKRRQIILTLVAWLSEGHILLEDVPGVAKTVLVRALARSVNGSFKRIQCTPDLLPTDVTGVSIFNQKSTEFEFRPGPISSGPHLVQSLFAEVQRCRCGVCLEVSPGPVTFDSVAPLRYAPFQLGFGKEGCFRKVDLHAMAGGLDVANVDQLVQRGRPQPGDWPATGVQR